MRVHLLSAGLLSTLLLTATACSGSGGDPDSGIDAWEDGGDMNTPCQQDECHFPYTIPGEHPLVDEMGQERNFLEVHLVCQIDFEDVQADFLIKAEPVSVTYFDIDYQVLEVYLCRDGLVESLPIDAALFDVRHHGWKDVQITFDGRRYEFDFSEVCAGARPCTPWPDFFDVVRADDGTPIAEAQPTVCAAVGRGGHPAPLTRQVRIPPEGEGSSFSMGSEEGDPDEMPVHTFEVYPVRIDVREASNLDFSAFLNDQGNDCQGHPCVDLQAEGQRIAHQDGCYQAEAGFQHHPVVQVSWYGALEYCYWRRMDLPTEANWETAASALGNRRYPWGDQQPDCDLANFSDCQTGIPDAACSREAGNSREGICDLSGNVSEWVRDWYLADHYSTCGASPGSCVQGPYQDTGLKVHRGGSFSTPAYNLRAADRDSAEPQSTAPDRGVRCISTNPSF